MSEQKMIRQCCNAQKVYRIVYGVLGDITPIKVNQDGSKKGIKDIAGTVDQIIYDRNGKPSLQVVYRKNLEALVCIKHLFSEQTYLHDPSQSYRPFLEDMIEMECVLCHRNVMATGGCKRCYSYTHVLVTCAVCGMTLEGDPAEHLATHSDIQDTPTTPKAISNYFRRSFVE